MSLAQGKKDFQCRYTLHRTLETLILNPLYWHKVRKILLGSETFLASIHFIWHQGKEKDRKGRVANYGRNCWLLRADSPLKRKRISRRPDWLGDVKFIDTTGWTKDWKATGMFLAPHFPRAAQAPKCGTDNKVIYCQTVMCVAFLSSPQLLKLYSVGDTQ